MSVQQAIDAPRISLTSAGGNVSLEPGFPPQTITDLKDLGHNITNAARDTGSVQAVIIDQHTGKQYGGADPRREGTVIGLPR
jgi:gamma-glutamyltranspeptidase / glutathione hydrolase